MTDGNHKHSFIDTYLHYCRVSRQREARYLCEKCGYAECPNCGAFMVMIEVDELKERQEFRS